MHKQEAEMRRDISTSSRVTYLEYLFFPLSCEHNLKKDEQFAPECYLAEKKKANCLINQFHELKILVFPILKRPCSLLGNNFKPNTRLTSILLHKQCIPIRRIVGI